MAGIILIVMGFARLGSVIKFIPYPLIVGFTSGIALIILSSQVKDFFGLQMGAIPADFIDKWKSYIDHFRTINIYTVLIGSSTIAIITLWPKVTGKVPGSLIAILFTTAIMHLLHLPVETIGSKFGSISSSLPKAVIPHLDLTTIKNLIQPAFTIALLAGIESLLSAIVSDGMIGGNHRSNMELIAQGTANIFSAVFGGIPATGAIARTATNVKNGGRTPVAGMIHSITLLLILLFFGKWASLIPLATLAGILVVVAYNMSEWRHFLSVLKGPKSDRSILLMTFLLTVLVDLTVAIEMGLILAAFLFLRNMIRSTEVSTLKEEMEDLTVPKHVEVFEINGPLFFGAAYKFKDAMRLIERPPKVLIIRMRKVPIIDATGLKTIKDVYSGSKQAGTRLILSEVHSGQVMEELRKARLVFAIGKANITDTFEEAKQRSKVILLEAGLVLPVS
jgi:SulP family sulfate permease